MRIFLIITIAGLLLSACGATGTTSKNLPPGDAARGAVLFGQSINGAPACTTCHRVDGTVVVGPSLKGFASIAGTRIANMSATEFAYQSIVNPASYLESGYSNLMYNQYAQNLDSQQIADLVAYLLTL